MCSPNTRAIVLTGLRGWANNPNSPKIYWMNGMAGTGKTTITYSLCDELKRAFQLGASFFCSRLLLDCRNVTMMVLTIAYQLAGFSHAFRSALCEVLDSDRDISTYNIDTQLEKLVKDPLLKVKDTLATNAVVVIDALDECSDANGTQIILDMLFRYASDIPIKFFVTSRPEPSISEKILTGDGRSRSILILHDIDRSIVQADIETYLSSKLAALSLRPRVKSNNSQNEQIISSSMLSPLYNTFCQTGALSILANASKPC
jgi:Cdc6-like AAA superfamily ATPase